MSQRRVGTKEAEASSEVLELAKRIAQLNNFEVKAELTRFGLSTRGTHETLCARLILVGLVSPRD